MKKKVWILNHYAGGTLFNKGGRHYNISKFLKQSGYEPVVFVSNTQTGKKERYIQTEELWTEKIAEEIGVPYIYVKAKTYSGNGKARIINMYQYYKNVKKAAKKYAKNHGKPDIIYASSVHPLTLIAGLKLARFFHVKCICEVRDLWPESLVAYGHLKRHSLLAKILYAFEKKIYIKSDKIIMTWPGGYDYICDRGWDSMIPSDKVVHISNGIDLNKYRENITAHPYSDVELENPKTKKIIYTGSIREVNNLGEIVSAAELLQREGITGFKILVYGSGSERDKLIRRAEENQLSNITFVGRIPKENVPAVLDKAYVTLLHNTSTSLDKYGQSQNKFFEYLAAEKPILMTYSVGHSICKENNCGIEIEKQNPETIAATIKEILSFSEEEYQTLCTNAKETAKKYDFRILTQKLIDTIECL